MIAAWSAHQPATSSRHIIREKTKRRSPGCSEARCGSVLWCQARLARRVGGRHRLRRASHRTADARTSFACQAASAQPAQGRRPEVDDRAITLGREFHAERPNQRWIAEFASRTFGSPISGPQRVGFTLQPSSTVSRRVVGWSMKAEMTAGFVTDALMMAIWRRGKPDALLHHSDQGSQYASEPFQKLMTDNGITSSMSRSGNVWGNAAMESLFAASRGPSGLVAEDRADQRQGLSDTQRCSSRRVRSHRAVLQRRSPALDHRIHQSGRVRKEGRVSLPNCP